MSSKLCGVTRQLLPDLPDRPETPDFPDFPMDDARAECKSLRLSGTSPVVAMLVLGARGPAAAPHGRATTQLSLARSPGRTQGHPSARPAASHTHRHCLAAQTDAPDRHSSCCSPSRPAAPGPGVWTQRGGGQRMNSVVPKVWKLIIHEPVCEPKFIQRTQDEHRQRPRCLSGRTRTPRPAHPSYCPQSDGRVNLWEAKHNCVATETEKVLLYGQLPSIVKMDNTLGTLKAAKHLALSSNCIEKNTGLKGLDVPEVLSLGHNCIKKLEGLDDVAPTLQQLWIST